MDPVIAFARLSEMDIAEVLAHMSDPRLAEHMPLMPSAWDEASIAEFIATKEARWESDGLGHWAILSDGAYVGWGGFEKEGDEWDFGLVLRPDAFGLGLKIVRKAIQYAITDERIPYVTALLPPSRKHLGALRRFGARQVDEIDYDGKRFLKFRLETEAN